MKRAFVLGILVMGLLALPGLADLHVPTGYPTITAALAAAEPGDTIVVDPAYTGVGETYPILVQKDNITIDGTGVTLEVGNIRSKAVFVVGAYREYDHDTHEYVAKPISGVTIKGFTITSDTVAMTADVGFVIKNATGVTIQGNTIAPITEKGDKVLEGIRLIDAEGCNIVGNTILAVDGIGLLIQDSDKNILELNTVIDCGLGLFVFESQGNTVTNDIYTLNANGGVVLNDSLGNTLSGLLVTKNKGWGVRFVFADKNKLLNSNIHENTWGGVELLGSQDNVVEGNLVYSNGTANDGSDDAQIVITKGDKAIFTTDVFSKYNELGDLAEFVEEKHEVYDKLDLLWWWLEDLDSEMMEIRQKIATAIGMCVEEDNPRKIIDWIDTIIYEKHYIDNPQTASLTTDTGVLIREFWDRYPVHRPDAIEDPYHNFTLENSKHPLTEKLDFYEEGVVNDFGLDRDGPDDVYSNDDELSWDKLTIIDIIISAIGHEIWNDFRAGWQGNTIDSLKEKIDYFLEKGLITAQDADDLDEKLNAVLGFLAQIEVIMGELEGKLGVVDAHLEAAITELGAPDYGAAKDELLAAKDWVELFILEKLKILFIIWHDISYKLCLVDIELPPFPEVNTDVVGKKEKPFAPITAGEITDMKEAIVAGLNADPTAVYIRSAVACTWPIPTGWTDADIEVDHKGLRDSIGNTISSNVITSDLLNSDRNIGIVIECPHNIIVNNVITNEWVEPIDPEPVHQELHRLDVAMILLGNENLIAYNAIEFINNGIIRGGKWWRKDIQVEYVFTKMAEVAYWPPPGYEICDWCGCHDAEDFVSRPVVWVPVLSVPQVKKLTDVGFAESQTVKRNRLSLNFFEYCGTGIDILDAESNTIDENLFYNCANGGVIFRAPFEMIMPDGTENPIGGASTNIILRKNDYYGGVAVYNELGLPVDASKDYTPPEGQPGHSICVGEVNPPAATAPFAFANFGTIDKFELLNAWLGSYGMAFDMTTLFPGEEAEEILPPNLEFVFPGVVLPEEKPRHPKDVFAEEGPTPPTPACLSRSFPYGWNMVSIPLSATDPASSAVFGDDVSPLLLFAYDGTEYVEPTEVFPTVGYWIWLYGETELDMCGTLPPTEEVTLAAAGWHMISKSGTAITLKHIDVTDGTDTLDWADAVTAGWVQPFAFWWNPATKAYDPVDPNDWIDPWNGYWIKTLEDGLTIILPQKPPDGPASALSPEALGVPSELPPPPPPLPPLAADGLTVRNYPNPIRDVHTTKFQVFAAQPVEAMRVRVYDLSGRLVWQDEAPGGELEWHTDDFTGKFLANGVYLYQAEVKIAGEWHVTKVEKLVIVR